MLPTLGIVKSISYTVLFFVTGDSHYTPKLEILLFIAILLVPQTRSQSR